MNIPFIDLSKLIYFMSIMKNKKVIFWGTGNMSKILDEYLPINVDYYVDNNKEKLGKLFNGKIIKMPQSIKKEKPNEYIIVIASQYFKEIYNQSVSMGLSENKDFIDGRILYNFISICKNESIIEELRKVYWDTRAFDIYETYNNITDDFLGLEFLLDNEKPNRILEIGCGSGRLFPIYIKRNIEEIVGEDISKNALNICKEKYSKVKLLNCNIENINYPDNYFDLIISNRVLSAVPPYKIAAVADKLSKLGKAIYLNEYSDKDYEGESDYWYKHNYDKLFSINGLQSMNICNFNYKYFKKE